MAFQAAKEFLEKRGFGDRIKEFDVSSATVELAAVAVGCEPAHIAKTLSFLTVYLDESLRRFDVVYPACGSSNSAVKLSIPDLEKSCDFEQWVDVCKLPQ